MADTLVHLQQMVENLQALNATLAQEQQLLCAGQVDAVRLQTVTLEKRICWPICVTSINAAATMRPSRPTPIRSRPRYGKRS
ncbi:hypothetical protein O0544_23330 [Edwardsiella anguillarum]|nr:hypothetical protein [Edwardsiella anguillarum]